MPTPPVTAFLKEQLNKPTDESKKWRMATIGLKGVAAFFIVGAAMFGFFPAVAGQMATLVQFTLTAWGAIIAMFIGAQGGVEYRTVAALQASRETTPAPVVAEVKVVAEGDSGAPVKKPFGQRATEEG